MVRDKNPDMAEIYDNLERKGNRDNLDIGNSGEMRSGAP